MSDSARTAKSGPSNLTGSGLALLVHAVFLLSGISALLYQLVWQRSLLMIYGSNIESVAMVVSAFLVGLGIGSLAGGALSKLKNVPVLGLFSAIELLVALYGVFSLHLFYFVGSRTLQAPAWATGIATFGLVFFPTLLMGATLPLLVAYRVRLTASVGGSVSWLYFVNTLGAGAGAFLAAFVILPHFGLSGTARVAALLNGISAVAVFCAGTLRRDFR